MKESGTLFSAWSWVKTKGRTLALASITQAAVELPVFGFSALSLLFFGAGLSVLQVLVLPSAFFFGAYLTSHWFGRVADGKKGIRIPLSAVQLFSGIFLVCAAFTGNFWLLLAEAFLYGSANAPGMALTTKALSDWFQEGRATAISVKMVVMSFVGAFTVWHLADYGLTGGFLILGAFQLLSALLNFLFYEEYTDTSLRTAPTQQDRERAANWDIRTDPNYKRLRFAGWVFGAAQYTFVVSALRFMTHSGIEANDARGVLVLSLFFAAGGRMVMSWMSDHWYGGLRKPMLRANFGFGALMLGILAFAPFAHPLILKCAVVLFGLSGLTIGVMNQAMGAELAPKPKTGEGAGYTTKHVKLGQMSGPLAFGALALVLPYEVGWGIFAVLFAAAWKYIGGIVETKPVKRNSRPADSRGTRIPIGRRRAAA